MPESSKTRRPQIRQASRKEIAHWGNHGSPWREQIPERPFYPSFSGSIEADVVVVGGGIAGLTTAVLLQKAGERVVLLTEDRLSTSTTADSSGHVTVALDTSYAELTSTFHRAAVKLILESQREAVETIARFARESASNCDLTRISGFRFTESKKQIKELKEEASFLSTLGYPARFTTDVPLPFSTCGAVVFENQIRFNPLAYQEALARLFIERGGQLFEHSQVNSVSEHLGGVLAECNNGEIIAAAGVLATHSPTGSFLRVQAKVHAYQSYLMAIRSQKPLTDNLFWDTAKPYHYIRRQESRMPDLVLIGGEDHRTGDKLDTYLPYFDLETYVRDYFGESEIVNWWSAELFEPLDGVAYIGKIPGTQALYTGTGFSGVGLTFGTLSGLLLRDLILGYENPYSEIYSPDRKNVKGSIGRFVTEIGARFYRQLQRKSETTRSISIDSIPVGEGRVIEDRGERLAVFRQSEETYITCSAICTHRGGIVTWNSAEKTWDCPLHGGRYRADGTSISAPPSEGLPKRDLPKNMG